MTRSTFALGAMAALVLTLAGCSAPATPLYDAKFGEAVRQAQALQTLYPEASRNSDPVTGIDGSAGKAAIDRYQESFRRPARTFDVFEIGGELQGQSQ